MKKYLLIKIFVIGVTILFFGASVLPSVLGNNHSSMDRILEECVQMSPSSEVDYLVLSAGNANVKWQYKVGRPLVAEANATCLPDDEFTHDLTEPSTLYVIVILNTVLDIRHDRILPRDGVYEMQVKANGVGKIETSYMRGTDHGNNSEYMGIILPIEIENNKTLTINIDVLVWAKIGPITLPWIANIDSRNVIVHVQLS